MSPLVEVVVLCPVPLVSFLGLCSLGLVGTRCWPDEALFHQTYHLDPFLRGGGRVQALYHSWSLYSMLESRSYVEEWKICVREMGESLCGLETAAEAEKLYGHVHHKVCVVQKVAMSVKC